MVCKCLAAVKFEAAVLETGVICLQYPLMAMDDETAVL